MAGPRGRCPGHESEAERTRGSSTARGYGSAYRRARARALDGATTCAACGQPFTEENPATGGHVVAQRAGGTLADGVRPECRKCNLGWRRTGL